MKIHCALCEKEVSQPRKGVDFVICDDCKRKKGLKEQHENLS